ncbi:MAG: hypothetical protein VKL42_07920 [Snowella sp.]|nr:hypothetical protein [Snowella sp.]
MRFLFCCLNAIAILAALPVTAQSLPKFCGTEFTFQGKPYCVKTLATDNEEIMIETVSPLGYFGGESISGLEYRQYQLRTTCENSQSELDPNSIFLIQLRYLNEQGKVLVPNSTSEPLKPANYDSDLAWTAYQISCESPSKTL